MVLYVADATAGVVFYPIEVFEQRNEEWREWFEDLSEEEIWEFQKHGVAFGEISASGNYFVFWNGQVYYSGHDGGNDEPLGTLPEFLDHIAQNPAQFLYDAGCYTRYGDEQWIPGKYVPNLTL